MIPTHQQSFNLGDVASRATQDMQNLRLQIEKLLKTMEVVNNIKNVPEISLPPVEASEVNDIPDVRMDWNCAVGAKRQQRKGKVMAPAPESYSSNNLCNRIAGRDTDISDSNLSSLEKFEMRVQLETAKYYLKEDSIFFAPVLERCAFGMTVRNVFDKKLPAPTVRLRWVPRRDSGPGPIGDENQCRTFLYHTKIILKEGCSSSALPLQDTFTSYQNRQFNVAPGGEVLVFANFAYPFQFLASKSFRLLVTLCLEGKELWTRLILIRNHILNASENDSVMKKHQIDVVRALSTESQGFRLERIASKEGRLPKNSMERFLTNTGYTNVTSNRTGIDTTVEFYTTNQPSLFWGSCFLMETSSRNETTARCLISARSKEQMQVLLQLLKSWMHNESLKDKQNGLEGLKLSSLNLRTYSNIQSKLENEIQHMHSLLYKKLVVGNENRKSDEEGSFGINEGNEPETKIKDSEWIGKYISIVAKTDAIFVELMK